MIQWNDGYRMALFIYHVNKYLLVIANPYIILGSVRLSSHRNRHSNNANFLEQNQSCVLPTIDYPRYYQAQSPNAQAAH